MGGDKELFECLQLELRRGTLVLSVLSQMREAKYGYALVQSLLEKGITIDPNTLYPLLRRLESHGILESEWETGGPKPRKYYKRTEYGAKIYSELLDEWNQMTQAMDKLTEGEGQ